MKHKKSIIWFRQDLRLHDNEAIWESYQISECLIPVYVFDTRIFNKTSPSGIPRIGSNRTRFLLESILDLKQTFQKHGIDLIIRVGAPEIVIPELADTHQVHLVYCNRERTSEEVKVQNALEENLWNLGKELRYTRGKMLYYTADLPFPIKHTPDTFASFKKEVDRIVTIREPLNTETLVFQPWDFEIDVDALPEIATLCKDEACVPAIMRGGESEALKALNALLSKIDNKESIDSCITELSPYLSMGCLSPKLLYQKSVELGKNKKYSSILKRIRLHLLERDFHRLMGKKHTESIFMLDGILKHEPALFPKNYDLFERWSTGNTNVPIVDACMRSLNKYGYVNYKMRYLLAYYWIHVMEGNWLLGAEWFEYKLLDYDPCSNYNNWNTLAGVGADFHPIKPINVASYTKSIDPKFTMIKKELFPSCDMSVDAIQEMVNMN